MIDAEVSRVFDRRSAMLLGAGAILTSALVMRMLQMQVFNFGDYKRKSENNSLRIQVQLSERGKILSASGTPISRDVPIYRTYIIPEESDDATALVMLVSKNLLLRQKRIDKIFATIKRQAKFQPVLISENSDWKKLADLQAQNLPGLYIKSGFARSYEMGPAGAQIFGFVGAPKTPVPNAPFFSSGIAGLEKAFNDQLAGTPGQTVMISNAVGRITAEDKSGYIEPIAGENLKTTINDNVQRSLYNALAADKMGSGIVIEISTGNIMAMVSAPGFDANRFRSDDSDEYIADLINNIGKPFMNKSVEGLYPPGSVFKIVVALAALESGALSPSEKIFCPGHFDYGDRRYNCWEHKGHGNVDLTDALKHSCDTYFYQIALRVGIDAIGAMAARLGLTEKFMDGVLPREIAGVMPDRFWKEKNIGTRWVHGDTIISGIGQGFVLSNGLELCIMMARVCANAKITPKLIDDGRIQKFESLHLQQKNINSVMRGLDAVLTPGGTASGSAINVNGKKMGGKTGTSQVRNISVSERESGVLTNEQLNWNMRNHGLFVGYAPTTAPKYAIAVIVEHAGTSTPAARTAAATMREVLKNG